MKKFLSTAAGYMKYVLGLSSDMDFSRTENEKWEQSVDKKLQKLEYTLEDKTILGTGQQGDISIPDCDRLRHTYMVGKTGMGKSSLMESLILQDIKQGKGVAVIDPHGDLYAKILAQIPKNRTNDVVLFDPSDIEFPVGFNILENSQDQLDSLIASGTIGVFKKIFGHSWGPRMEYILRNSILTLLDQPNSTLQNLAMLLTDYEYRKRIVGKTRNEFLKRFWTEEFGSMSPARQQEVVSPILNKIGQFLSIPLIRNIISQPKSGFSPRWVMDNKKIFLANLSKGKIGEDVSEMMGSMLVTKFQLDAMSRADIAEKDRVPFYMYVDEFQNFATESFADILSESRKYGLSLTLANQYIGQLHESVTDAIFGNIATLVTFQLGYSDARILSNLLGRNISTSLLTHLFKYDFIARMTKDGDHISWQRGTTKLPSSIRNFPNEAITQKLTDVSRQKFAKTRKFVESKIEL